MAAAISDEARGITRGVSWMHGAWGKADIASPS